MGDSDKEVSEADMEAASEKRAEAAAAFAEGEHQKAVDLYTEAIELNPGKAGCGTGVKYVWCCLVYMS